MFASIRLVIALSIIINIINRLNKINLNLSHAEK